MTMSKSIVMLSVGVLVMACYASNAKMPYSEFMDVLYNETMQYKHSRCFRPDSVSQSNPNKVYQALAYRTIQRWFYDPFVRACRPLFTDANFTYTTDDKNYNLPRTRIECETLCANYCLVDHRDGTTEMGICMSSGFGGGVPNSCMDALPEAHPKQCPQLYSRCCPRRYRDLINNPVTSPTVAPTTTVDPSTRQNRSVDETTAPRRSRLHTTGSSSSSS